MELTYELGHDLAFGYIRCLVCGFKSFHPSDIENKYCGKCHRYHNSPQAVPADRTDRIEMKGGVVNLPAEFREVALRANLAGVEGYELADAEMGVDIEEARRILAQPSLGARMDAMSDGLKSYVTLTYRKKKE